MLPETSPFNTFVIGRKRAITLGVSLIVTIGACALSLLMPRDHYKQLPLEQLEVVSDRQFINETVIADGKSFENCLFNNVTFRLKGDHNWALKHNQFSGTIKITFDSMAAKGAADVLVNMLNNANMITNGRIGFVNNDDVVLDYKGVSQQ
jgi:hypothetical protein